jgi:hypothetical protein
MTDRSRPWATPRYTLHVEWAGDAPDGAADAYLLLAGDLDDAKIEAAIIYAALDYSTLPPIYRIVTGAHRVAYRFPETDWRAFAATP